MQIVIDIPEVFYEALKETDTIISSQRSGKSLMSVIFDAVASGTPLPKGHGRLIDADALNRKDVNCANVPMNFIDTAQTIIEADKSAIEDAIIEEAEEYEADLDN